MENLDAKAEELWKKFFVLSQEMLKFLEREEIDLFLSLMEQRGQIQNMLEVLGPSKWTKSLAGQQLYQQLMPVDRQIHYKARQWLNKSKKSQQVVSAYDRMSAAAAGSIFNRQL